MGANFIFELDFVAPKFIVRFDVAYNECY